MLGDLLPATRYVVRLAAVNRAGRGLFTDSQPPVSTLPAGWRGGVVVSGVRRMNEVNARRARLVPGWVTVFGRVYHIGM